MESLNTDVLSRIARVAVGDVFTVSSIDALMCVPTMRQACLNMNASDFVDAELHFVDNKLIAQEPSSRSEFMVRPTRAYMSSTLEPILSQLKTATIVNHKGSLDNVFAALCNLENVTIDLRKGSTINMDMIPARASRVSVRTSKISCIDVPNFARSVGVYALSVEVSDREKHTDIDMLKMCRSVVPSTTDESWIWGSDGIQDTYESVYVKCKLVAILRSTRPTVLRIVLPASFYYSILWSRGFNETYTPFKNLKSLIIGSELNPLSSRDGNLLMQSISGVVALKMWIKPERHRYRIVYGIPASIESFVIYVVGLELGLLMLRPESYKCAIQNIEIYSERFAVEGISKIGAACTSLSVSGAASLIFSDIQDVFTASHESFESMKSLERVRIRLVHDVLDFTRSQIDVILPGYAIVASVKRLEVSTSSAKWCDPWNAIGEDSPTMQDLSVPFFIHLPEDACFRIKSKATFAHVFVHREVVDAWAAPLVVWGICWAYINFTRDIGVQMIHVPKSKALKDVHVVVDTRKEYVATPILEWMMLKTETMSMLKMLSETVAESP